MMIDKRLINTVAESKRWIIIHVLWNWIALLGGIVSAVIVAYLLQSAYDKNLDWLQVTILCSVLVLALILRVFAGKRAINASYHASKQVKHHLRTLIYHKIAEMPLNQVQSLSTSSIIQVASEGVEQLEIYFGRYLPQLFYSLLAPLTLFVFLIFFNASTAIILLLCVPLIPISIIAVNKIAKKLLAKYWSIYVGLGSNFLDNLQGLVTLKIYQDDEFKALAMDKEAETFRKITMKVLTMQLNSVSLMDLLAYGGFAVGIIVALFQFQAGEMTMFALLLFILLASEFFIPLRLLGSFFHVAMNGKAASNKIFTLLDTPVKRPSNTKLFQQPKNVQIHIQSLHFRYPTAKREAICDLSLDIASNQLTVFVGKSGCGKSTLVSLLMGFHTADTGEIYFNQQCLAEIDRRTFYQKVALVSHSSYLFKGSLRENMQMAKPNATDDEIYQALAEVNLAKFVRENGGVEMPLLSRGSNLSGGQIQRLALARALLHDASVYIFDEATSNIDIESEEIILQFIQKLKAHKTIIFISHRLANAIHADQIYVLDQGKLCESGTHESLMAQAGQYAQMFQQQQHLEKIRINKEEQVNA